MIKNRRSVRALFTLGVVVVTAVGCSNREGGADSTNAPATEAPSTEAPTSDAPTTEAPAGEMFGDMIKANPEIAGKIDAEIRAKLLAKVEPPLPDTEVLEEDDEAAA